MRSSSVGVFGRLSALHTIASRFFRRRVLQALCWKSISESPQLLALLSSHRESRASNSVVLARLWRYRHTDLGKRLPGDRSRKARDCGGRMDRSAAAKGSHLRIKAEWQDSRTFRPDPCGRRYRLSYAIRWLPVVLGSRRPRGGMFALQQWQTHIHAASRDGLQSKIARLSAWRSKSVPLFATE